LGWGLTGTFGELLPHFTTFEVLSIRLWSHFFAGTPIFPDFIVPFGQGIFSFGSMPIGFLLSSLMFYYLFAVRAFQLAPVSIAGALL